MILRQSWIQLLFEFHQVWNFSITFNGSINSFNLLLILFLRGACKSFPFEAMKKLYNFGHIYDIPGPPFHECIHSDINFVNNFPEKSFKWTLGKLSTRKQISISGNFHCRYNLYSQSLIFEFIFEYFRTSSLNRSLPSLVRNLCWRKQMRRLLELLEWRSFTLPMFTWISLWPWSSCLHVGRSSSRMQKWRFVIHCKSHLNNLFDKLLFTVL